MGGLGDVKAPDGTRIEVKTSRLPPELDAEAALQPELWRRGPTAGQAWDENLGRDVVMPDGRVHVWVFALHTTRDPDAYRALDLTAWRFWVAPHATIRALKQKTAALSTIHRIAAEKDLDGLAEAIARARGDHDAQVASAQ